MKQPKIKKESPEKAAPGAGCGGAQSPTRVCGDPTPLRCDGNGPGRRICPQGGDFPLAGPKRCAVPSTQRWAASCPSPGLSPPGGLLASTCCQPKSLEVVVVGWGQKNGFQFISCPGKAPVCPLRLLGDQVPVTSSAPQGTPQHQILARAAQTLSSACPSMGTSTPPWGTKAIVVPLKHWQGFSSWSPFCETPHRPSSSAGRGEPQLIALAPVVQEGGERSKEGGFFCLVGFYSFLNCFLRVTAEGNVVPAAGRGFLGCAVPVPP